MVFFQKTCNFAIRKGKTDMNKIMIKRQCLRIAYMAFFLLLLSCHGKENTGSSLLIEADSLIEDNPQEAIALLQNLKPRIAKKGKSDRMHYALLSIKAKDKADVPLTDIDEIEKIVKYYEDNADDKLLPLAYYYAGRTYADNNDALTALSYFHKAEEILTRTNSDIGLLATVYSQEGYLLNLRRMFIDARECFQKAYECDKSIQDTVGMVCDLQDIGKSYTWNKEEKECLRYLKQAYDLARKTGDQKLILGIERSLAFNYKDLQMYDSAWVYARHLMYADSSSYYAIAPYLFFQTGQLDSAAFYCNKLLLSDNLYGKNQSHRMLTEIALRRNDSRVALEHFLAHKTLEDSIDEMNGTEAVALAKGLYDYQQHEMEKQMLETKNEKYKVIIGFVLMGALIVLLVGVALWQYGKRKHLELEDRFLRLQLLHEENLRKRELHQKKMDDVADRMEKTDAYKAFVEILKNKQNPKKEDWVGLEQMLNTHYDNCIQNLQDLCKMSDRELQVSMLTKINFRPLDIATILNISQNSVASIRSRLYKKYFGEKGKAKDWDDFILNL